MLEILEDLLKRASWLLPSRIEGLDIGRIFSKRFKDRGIHEFRDGSIGGR
jgi:hypothetical protein